MKGVVQSGETGQYNVQPLSGALVTLYDASTGSSIGSSTSASDGSFTITPTTTSSDSIFYVTADVGDGVILMTMIGPDLSYDIVINELTTVAAVWCAAQFLDNGQISGDSFGLGIAAGMNRNLVSITRGESSGVLTASPNGDETNALRATRSLANLLASCVRDPEFARHIVFDLATPPGGTRPTDTISALHNIVRFPANQVGGLYAQSMAFDVYPRHLFCEPDSWTIAVKVNDSGSTQVLFGGPANLKFDKNGRAWITNNVVQGSGQSSEYSIVLGPDGRPGVDANGKRITPFSGGGLIGSGFGIDIDKSGNVWIGNFGWGGEAYWPSPSGSVSKFSSDAVAISPDDTGYQEGIYRVQGTVVDPSGNVWLAGYQSHSVACYLGGDHCSVLTYTGDSDFDAFGIAIAQDGSAWVTNSNPAKGGMINLQIGSTSLQLRSTIQIGRTVKGIVIDQKGHIWIASGGDDTVYAYESDGTPIGAFNRGGVAGPWGICVDGADNVWVGNFGPLRRGSIFTGRLTQLAGANDDTRPEGLETGDPMTPPSGYTLPSAGSQVLLGNEEPLYGPEGPPCFIPMTRTTGVAVDAAGNVWTCNNWKPNFDTDVQSNPGGDGMIIWIGLATPMPRPEY